MKESFLGKGQQLIEVLRVKANLFIYAGANENFQKRRGEINCNSPKERNKEVQWKTFFSHMPRGLNLR